MSVAEIRTVAAGALALAFAFCQPSALAIDASNRYRSPRNPERKVRASTELIVLHTTEAPARSSLNKLSERGEAHFCVTQEGEVYRIVDLNREAFHAGRSMWNGREDVDKFSVGIECVGNHDKPMPKVQLIAIRDLVKDLKRIYRIPDERVVCHSHVAYGSPNKWQRRRHRGRKRCGMLFAMPSVRRSLELWKRPAFDSDTRSQRLTIGDDYLQKVLYGSVDTMLAHYGGASRLPVAPAPKPVAPAPKPVVSAPRPAVSAHRAVATARPAKAQPAQLPDASKGAPRSIADLRARGYELKGMVTKEQSASRLAGKRWNASDTFYTIRNKVFPGNTMDAAHIERGMGVWMRQ